MFRDMCFSSFLVAGIVAFACSETAGAQTAAELWQEIGTDSASGRGVSNTDGWSVLPTAVLDSGGEAIVCWADNTSGDYEVYVKRWNGSSWVTMGTGSASNEGISNTDGASTDPDMAIDSNGNVFVCWLEEDDATGDFSIYLRKWNGSSWVELGGSASSGGISGARFLASDPAVAVQSDGKPIVCWADSGVYVKYWTGSVWAEKGTGSASNGGIGGSAPKECDIAILNNGMPAVCWKDNYDYIYVKQWTGSVWDKLGTGSDSGTGISGSGWAYHPRIACGDLGPPYITWMYYVSQTSYPDIYVKTWDGSNWVETNTGSASGGGISNNEGKSKYPSIAIDSDDNPIICWQDDTDLGGNRAVYVRRWNGSAWAEMGTGSASGTGINGVLAEAYRPTVAAGPNGDPVICWQEEIYNFSEVYVKKFSCSPSPLAVRVTGFAWASDGTVATVSYQANQPAMRYYYRMYQTQSTYTSTTSTDAGFNALDEGYYLFVVTARNMAGQFAPEPCRVWFYNKPVGATYQVSLASYEVNHDSMTFTLRANEPTSVYYVRLYSLESAMSRCTTGVVTYSGLADGLYYFVATGRELATGSFPPGGPARQFFYINTAGF